MSEESSGPDRLRIVYMGTPDFAVPALEALVDSRNKVVGVITRPDRRRGRGKKMKPTAVKAAAQSADLDVFQPEDVNSAASVETLQQWDPDVIVVAAFGQIIKSEILDLPTYGCLNIHASLLPRHRGAAPINWAIACGDEETGITIMQMDEGLDTGPMLLKKKTLIAPMETAGELHDRLAEIGADLIVDVMRLIHLDSITAIDQDDEKSTYARMLSKKDGAIDWLQSAEEIANRIQGFNPWPGTYSFFESDEGEDERIKFHLARPVDPRKRDVTVDDDVEAGTIVCADRGDGELWIATGDGILQCLELQAPGRRAMDVGDFLNGHDMDVGQQFMSPEA